MPPRPLQSILAVQSDGLGQESMWQYQGQKVNDWEKDLVADDDDMLAETMQQHAKDGEVKATHIVPTLQGNSDFNQDYPKDEQGPLEPAFDDNRANKTTMKPEMQTQNTAKESKRGSKPVQAKKTQPGTPRRKDVESLKKEVESLKKEYKNATAIAKNAHASVRNKTTALRDKNNSIAKKRDALYTAASTFLECHKKEGKLEMDVLMTKQAKTALQARLGMLHKQRAAIDRKSVV